MFQQTSFKKTSLKKPFHSLRQFPLLTCGLLLLLLAVSGPVAGEEMPLSRIGENQAVDGPFPHPSLHGFFMFGADDIMLYHSAGFETTNHDYQLMIKVSLTPGSPAWTYYHEHYDEAVNQHLQWIVHNPHLHFTLPHLVSGEVTSFTGDIKFIGPNGYLPENQQPQELKNATIHVERIMYFRRFDLSADYPETLTYLVFGLGEDAYMAHYLTKRSATPSPPNGPRFPCNALAFDDVVRIDRPAWLPADEEDVFATTVEVKIPSVRVTTLPTESPLAANTTYNVTVHGISSLANIPLTVHVQKSNHFDTTVINDRCN